MPVLVSLLCANGMMKAQQKDRGLTLKKINSPQSSKITWLPVQKVELKVSRVLQLGPCDNSAGKYPLVKNHMSFEYLREHMHLRPRTTLIGAIFRIRNELAIVTHDFFQSHGFLYIQPPIITTSDCEGAEEQFQVSAPHRPVVSDICIGHTERPYLLLPLCLSREAHLLAGKSSVCLAACTGEYASVEDGPVGGTLRGGYSGGAGANGCPDVNR